MNLESRKVIFFDGVCGLCNGFVDFVMRHDLNGKFHFSPLQSEFAKETLPPEYTQNLSSVVLWSGGKTSMKTKAVFTVLKELGGAWSLLSTLGFLPTPLLNWGYDMVATNRYRLFGKKETCRLPTPEERQRFIL